ncbi:MAG: hypothetical protein Q9226_007741, partial [Calogaya cf. arnoldii]
SCTKAEEASSSSESAQSSRNASVRGTSGPEDKICRSDPDKSSNVEHARLDGQTSVYNSEDLEPSTDLPVKTDDEL